MYSLVAVGACFLDTILTVPHYPHEDTKLRASSLEKRRGGNVPNTLEVLQQLLQNQSQLGEGLAQSPLTLLSVLPARSSPASQHIRTSLGPDVELGHCIYREEATEAASSYIIRSLAADSRTIVSYNELKEMTIEEFAEVANRLSRDGNGKSQVYHFEGIIAETTARFIKYLRQNHPEVKVSVELENPKRPGLEELAKLADVIFYSKGWAQAKGYNSAEAFLEAEWATYNAASYMFCTWGEQGASAIASSTSTSALHCDAFTPPSPDQTSAKIVDTIGAGDTFIAGILFSLFFKKQLDVNSDPELKHTLSFANELAGWKVTQEGFRGLAEKVRR